METDHSKMETEKPYRLYIPSKAYLSIIRSSSNAKISRKKYRKKTIMTIKLEYNDSI